MRDWKLLIAQGENMNVDFKAAMSWDDTARRNALVADIVAMANVRDGGTLALGIEEDDGKRVVVGLTPEQASTFDVTKICDYVGRWFQPLVRLSVEHGEVDGRKLVAIIVAEFEATPIVCTKDGPEREGEKSKRHFYEGNVFVRTPAAKTVVIRTAEDMQRLIGLAVGKTSNVLLTDIRKIIEGTPPPEARTTTPYEAELRMWGDAVEDRRAHWRAKWKDLGSFSIVVLPQEPIPTQLDYAAMRRVVTESYVQAVGIRIPHCFPDQFMSIHNRPGAIEGLYDLEGYQEIWQLHKSGAFMFMTLLRLARSADTPEKVVEFELITFLIGLALLFAQRLYQALGATALDVLVEFEDMKGRRLSAWEWHRLRSGPYETREDRITIHENVTVLDLRSNWRAISGSIAKRVLQLFSCEMSDEGINVDLDKIQPRRI